MGWYKTGSVSVTQGQTSVTGVNTKFASNARVGDAFRGPDGEWYEVVNIASEVTLGIYPAYQGVTVVADANYTIAPMQGYVKDSADKLVALTEALGDVAADVAAAKASADSAALSATSANASSASASTSEASALTSKNSAETAATTATQKASEAYLSADSALASKNAAKISEDNAAASAEQAAAVAGDKQPTNAKLTAISNSILAANTILYATGVDTFGVADFTAYARSLVASSDAAGARSTLELIKTTSTLDTTTGSVLQVGDFGLGGSGVAITTTLLNSNNCPSGMYKLEVSSVSDSLPVGTYSILNIALDSAGACHQTAINNETKVVYRRVSVSGQWEVATSAVMVGATDTVAGTAGLVPAPSASSVVRYLSDRGDWRVIDTSTGSGRFFGELVSLPSRNSSPDGVIKADGQILSNASSLYPDAVADITSGSPTVPVTTTALWLSDPTKRLCWAYDSAANQIRVPDWNGKSVGSLGPAFFRGDGSLGFAPGTLRQDQIQNITGSLTGRGYVTAGVNGTLLSGAGAFSVSSKTGVAAPSLPTLGGSNANADVATFDTSAVARTGAETFPTHGVGVWGVVLFGTVSNAGAADAAALATSYANQQSQINTLDTVTGFAYVYFNGGSEGSPVNVAINSRYEAVNPFGDHPVICVPQLLYNGEWETCAPTAFGTTTASYGVLAAGRRDKIVARTGSAGLLITNPAGQLITTPTYPAANQTSLPCRAQVWRIKG